MTSDLIQTFFYYVVNYQWIIQIWMTQTETLLQHALIIFKEVLYAHWKKIVGKILPSLECFRALICNMALSP